MFQIAHAFSACTSQHFQAVLNISALHFCFLQKQGTRRVVDQVVNEVLLRCDQFEINRLASLVRRHTKRRCVDDEIRAGESTSVFRDPRKV